MPEPMIVDAHTHIYPPELALGRERFADCDAWFSFLYGDEQARVATAEDLIEEMDRSGVSASVICSFGWVDQRVCSELNDYLLAVAKTYPGRLLPFIAVQPRAGSAAADEVRRCAALGAYGIGELMPDGQGFSLDDEATVAPMVDAAVECDLPIMTHTSEPLGHMYPGKGTVTPDTVYRFAVRFPRAKLICSHWGGGLPFYELMPEVADTLRNVYYDTAASLFLYRSAIFPAAVAAVGARKVLFGTDYPLIGQRRFLRHIRESGLPAEAVRQILGENAARLFNLEGG